MGVVVASLSKKFYRRYQTCLGKVTMMAGIVFYLFSINSNIKARMESTYAWCLMFWATILIFRWQCLRMED